MDKLKAILQAIVVLFLIPIFITMFVELGKTTGQNVTTFIISMIIMGIGLIAVIVLTIYKMFFD